LAPDQKKARRAGATLVFLDETGFRLQPLNRRTWALVGSRPQQVVSQRHDRLSVIGSLSLSPARRHLRSHFVIHERNVRTPDVLRYLCELHRQHGGPLIVVLDRLNVHRSAVRRLRDRGAKWLRVEWLPAYAPELNPVEAMWSHTKYTSLANFVPDNVDHLFDAVAQAVNDVYFQPDLMTSFFQAAELSITTAQRPRREE
jgi:putative transposase